MDLTAKVIRPAQMSPMARGGGVRTWYLVTPDHGARTFVNGITEFDIAASLPLHWHNCEESVLILEGEAVFEAGGERHVMVPHDITWVPAGVSHRFANGGSGRLRIFWTYGSITPSRTLLATGETFAVNWTLDQTSTVQSAS